MRTSARCCPWSLGLCLGALAACSTHAQKLRPARDAHEVAGLDWAAVGAGNQIEVIVQTRSWRGDPRVLNEVEPLHVRIGNYGLRPVQFRYDNVRLVSERGEEYAPLWPGVDLLATGGRRLVTPRFSHSGFRVARYDAHAYAGPFVEAPSAPPHGRGARRWRSETFPMHAPLEWAIPEGVLEVGGFVDGYIFFEHVSRMDRRLRFEAMLSAPRPMPAKCADPLEESSAKSTVAEAGLAEQPIARISIPLEMD